MSDYLYIYRGGANREGRSPEVMQQVMQQWMAWLGELKAQGHLKSSGEPLEDTGKVVRNKTMITDGPYAESKDLVGGFSIVTADSLEKAAELSAGCPIFEAGGLVEVRPIMGM